jgi:hypothetical protein
MRWALPLLGMILLVQTAHAQGKKPWDVDKLCGRVEYVKRIPEKKHPNNYSEKRKSLRDVPLELYADGENQPCCDELKNVGSTKTGQNGRFEFKPEKAGRYWLMAKWNQKVYEVNVDFKPEKRSSTICSQQGIQVGDDGDASWWVTVTVD